MTVTMGHSRPFGLEDVKVTNMDGTLQADLPAGQVLSFVPRLVSGEMMGDNSLVSVIAFIIGGDWNLESGGIPLSALAIMTGEAATLDGVSPSQTMTMTFSAGDVMPYFKIYGKTIGDETDDVHVKMFKCKITTPPEGQLSGENFYIQKCGGVFIDDGTNGAIDIVQNETATDLPSS